MPRTKATACMVYPTRMGKKETEAHIGVWISDLTPPEQIQALGPQGLKRVSTGYVVEVDVPVTTAAQARDRAMTLAGVVQQVIHNELKQNFFIRKEPVVSNDQAKRALS